MTAYMAIGDSLDLVKKLGDESIDLVLTSPPFLALRSYLPSDHPDKGLEVGGEDSPATYIDTLLAHTAECVVLRRTARSQLSLATRTSGEAEWQEETDDRADHAYDFGDGRGLSRRTATTTRTEFLAVG
ncbi:hypothetical protein HS125_20555 [bacterium]|nr:hypothetical protein [bacterium]